LDKEQEIPAPLGFLDGLHEIFRIRDRFPVDRLNNVAGLDRGFLRRGAVKLLIERDLFS
jgi:hypothetical protein